MTGGNSDRALSSTTGMIIFIAIGAVLTASGTYLMLELGNEDIGATATVAFEANQDGERIVIEHTTGDSVASENLRVVGAKVVSMPDVRARPSANRTESMTLDFPDPFGPVTVVKSS